MEDLIWILVGLSAFTVLNSLWVWVFVTLEMSRQHSGQELEEEISAQQAA